MLMTIKSICLDVSFTSILINNLENNLENNLGKAPPLHARSDKHFSRKALLFVLVSENTLRKYR